MLEATDTKKKSAVQTEAVSEFERRSPFGLQEHF